MKRYLLLTLLISLSIAPELLARVWTDRQGRQTEAQFIRLRGDSVVLQKGMKPLVIPLKELCDEDQEYIKEQTKIKGGTKPATKNGNDSTDDPSPSTATKDAKSAEDDSNPFLTDAEKSPAGKPPSPAKTTPKPDEDDSDPFLTDAEKSSAGKPPSPAKTTPKPDEDDSNPFLTDTEKSSPKDVRSEAKKAKVEAPETPDVPKINTDGGFDSRGWTDVKGNKLTASFVRLDGKMVVLSKDGGEKQFPIDQFCYKDKLYIRQAALELKRYEKFAGKRESQIAANHSPPPSVAGPSTLPTMHRGAGDPRADAILEEMHQRALAEQQKMASQLQSSGSSAPPAPPQYAGPPTPMLGPRMPDPPVWHPTVTPTPQSPLMHDSTQPTIIVRQNTAQPGVTYQPSGQASSNAHAAAYRIGVFIGVGFAVLVVLCVGVAVIVVLVKMISG
jgi:hypothetical protein